MAYELRISACSSDVCSSDLLLFVGTAPLCGGLDMIADVVGGQAQLSCWLVADEYFRRQTDVHDSAVLLFYQSCLIHRDKESSEERLVGKECVSTCRVWWSPFHKKKQSLHSFHINHKT